MSRRRLIDIPQALIPLPSTTNHTAYANPLLWQPAKAFSVGPIKTNYNIYKTTLFLAPPAQTVNIRSLSTPSTGTRFFYAEWVADYTAFACVSVTNLNAQKLSFLINSLQVYWS